ncbi:hypothetical protein [Methylobacterium sp. D54C]
MASGLDVLDDDHEERAVRRTGVLPEDARRLYAEICNAAEDATDLTSSAMQRSVDDRHEVFRIKAEIDNFERQTKAYVDDPRYKQLQRGLITARNTRDTSKRRYEEKSETGGTLVALRSSIDEWLGEHHHKVIVPYDHPAPKLLKGEFPVAAVGRVRGLITEKRQERARVSRASIPAAEAKEAARAFVAQTATLARPDVSTLLAGSHEVYFPALASSAMMPVNNADFGMIVIGGKVYDGLALACWLQPETVIAAIDRDIDAAAVDKSAIPTATRIARLAELDAEILAAERDEVAFIAMAEAQGAVINHRRDVDPRALLQVTVEEAE